MKRSKTLKRLTIISGLVGYLGVEFEVVLLQPYLVLCEQIRYSPMNYLLHISEEEVSL